MKRETEFYLARTAKVLTEGDTMLGVGLNGAAARAAYFAAFHAAAGALDRAKRFTAQFAAIISGS